MIPEIERIASIENLVDKKLYFMGLLTRETEKRRVKPIVVGGSAVDFYTEGIFPSYDIDLVGNRKIIGEILEKDLGFTPSGRGWLNEQIGFSVEVPSFTLSGDNRDKIVTMRIESLPVYVIGLEDLIVDRIGACIFWKSQTDCTQARYLLKKYRDRLDIEYLEKKARDESLQEELRDFTEPGSSSIGQERQKRGRYPKRGWFEEQKPMVTGRGVEKKAPRHYGVSVKKKLKGTLREPAHQEK